MSLFSFMRHDEEVPKNKQIQDIELDKIVPNRYQPRREFSDDSIKELAETLDKDGLLQPIVVREDGEDHYEIIAGERRYRAAKSLNWETIPAIVNNMNDDQAASLALIENLQREDLTPLEEAQAYEMLQKNLGLTQEEVSKRMGKSRPYIANYLRLLTLPSKTKRLLQHGDLSMGQARTLLGLKDKDKIDALAKRVAKEGMPVRKVEALVSEMNAKKPQKKTVKKSAFIRASENQLSNKFGSSVNISETKKGKGHLSIDFASADELNRILDLLGVDLDG